MTTSGYSYESRRARGVSLSTLAFYRERLAKFGSGVNYFFDRVSRSRIEQHLSSIPPNERGLGTRHAEYRAMKAFYNWLAAEYGIANPMKSVRAPILGKPILPCLSRERVEGLLQLVDNRIDKAIIALFAESGLRLSELASIKASDIDWHSKTIRTLGKGRKEALAPFGSLSEGYLMAWLAELLP